MARAGTNWEGRLQVPVRLGDRTEGPVGAKHHTIINLNFTQL